MLEKSFAVIIFSPDKTYGIKYDSMYISPNKNI